MMTDKEFAETCKGSPAPLTRADGEALAKVPQTRWFTIHDCPHTIKNPYWRMMRLHEKGALATRVVGEPPHLERQWLYGKVHTVASNAPLRLYIVARTEELCVALARELGFGSSDFRRITRPEDLEGVQGGTLHVGLGASDLPGYFDILAIAQRRGVTVRRHNKKRQPYT